MAQQTTEERLARVEAEIGHRATKEEVVQDRGALRAVKEELERKIAESETRLIKWLIGVALAAAGVGASIAIVVQRMID